MTSVLNGINTESMCMFEQNAQAAKDQNSHQYSTTPWATQFHIPEIAK